MWSMWGGARKWSSGARELDSLGAVTYSAWPEMANAKSRTRWSGVQVERFVMVGKTLEKETARQDIQYALESLYSRRVEILSYGALNALENGDTEVTVRFKFS